MTRLSGTLLASLLFTALSMTHAMAAAAKPSVVPLDVQLVRLVTPVAAEGRQHLLYEMRLTNFSPRDVTLKSIDVTNARSGALIKQYAGDALAGMINKPGRSAQGGSPLAISPGEFVIVYFDTALGASDGMVDALALRIRIEPSKGTEAENHLVLDTAQVHIGDAPAPVVGAPLRGGSWLAANAFSNAADHRRTVAVVDGQARIAQRYAIDFVKLDKSGRAYVGDPSMNKNWVGYGSPVLAVADGVVESVRDDLPDNEPMKAPAIRITLETIGGNHVILALPDGGHVFYGHLKPGSVLVREGQRVKRGDVIAALGNSGQSDAPHLHIHFGDAASALGAEGLPFEFDQFRLEGHVPSLDVLENADGWKRPKGIVPTQRRHELPAENAVIAFP